MTKCCEVPFHGRSCSNFHLLRSVWSTPYGVLRMYYLRIVGRTPNRIIFISLLLAGFTQSKLLFWGPGILSCQHLTWVGSSKQARTCSSTFRSIVCNFGGIASSTTHTSVPYHPSSVRWQLLTRSAVGSKVICGLKEPEAQTLVPQRAQGISGSESKCPGLSKLSFVVSCGPSVTFQAAPGGSRAMEIGDPTLTMY